MYRFPCRLATFLCSAVLLCQGANAALRWSVANSAGQDSIDEKGVFETHARPSDYPYMEGTPRFNVAVNGAYVGLYNDRNYWGGNVAFGMFEFEDGKEIEIEISTREKIETFEILPKNAFFTEEPVLTTGSRSVRFKTNKADRKFTLVINGEYTGDVLHLFANSIDHNAPVRSKTTDPDGSGYYRDRKNKKLYFWKGYHKVTGGSMSVAGWEVYVAPGAVADGGLVFSGAQNGRIYGRGLIVNAERANVTKIEWSKNCSIEGVTLHGHNSQSWFNEVKNSQNCSYSNVNIINTRYASTDGLNVAQIEDCTFDNCFIRACDDAVTIKGLAAAETKPADCKPNKNLTFSRMQLWNDCNNAFTLGAESKASAYENIKLLDSDILFSYDDPVYHEKLPERSALNICMVHGTYVRDILYDDVRVNRCERFIGMCFLYDYDDPWSDQPSGDQTTPGGISNVTFRNVECNGMSNSSIANEIRLQGFESRDGLPEKWIENVTFDNVRINGNLLESSEDPHFKIIENVRNLVFKNSGVATVVNGKDDIKVYPTVIDRGNEITISAEGRSNASWKLYSIDGKLADKGEGFSVDTCNLASATYLLSVKTGNQLAKTCKIQIR